MSTNHSKNTNRMYEPLGLTSETITRKLAALNSRRQTSSMKDNPFIDITAIILFLRSLTNRTPGGTPNNVAIGIIHGAYRMYSVVASYEKLID